MKTLITILFLLSRFVVYSQSFEGTITIISDLQTGTPEERQALDESVKKGIRDKLEQFKRRESDPSLSKADRAVTNPTNG